MSNMDWFYDSMTPEERAEWAETGRLAEKTVKAAFARADREPCPMCGGAGYIVYGPEPWNNDFCPTCEGDRTVTR